MSTDEVKKHQEKVSPMSRRNFLKTAGAVIGTAAVASPLAACTTTGQGDEFWLPEKWDLEADVVVVGFGGGGATTALAAFDAGVEPLVLEAAPDGLEGGNSGCCGGLMSVPDSVDEAVKHYKYQLFGTAKDDELLRTVAESFQKLPGQLEKLGAKFTKSAAPNPYFPTAPGASTFYAYRPVGREGEPSGAYITWRSLRAAIDQKGIRVMYDTRGRELIQNVKTKEILGVVAEKDGQKLYIKAKKGVVLACGGYELDQDRIGWYNHPGVKFSNVGTPYNRGDGVKMCLSVNTDMWHNVSLEYLGYAFKVPSDIYDCGIGAVYQGVLPANNFMMVNAKGKRFVNESLNITHWKGPMEVFDFDQANADYFNMPFWVIFDDALYKAGPLGSSQDRPGPGAGGGWGTIHRVYDWSIDNNKELNAGWILKADTLKELAGKMKGTTPGGNTVTADAAGLEDAVSRFNELVVAGVDSDFGRRMNGVTTIEKPPFYAIEVSVMLVNTQGGPLHNKHGQTLDVDGNPIPRLYTVGELGSVFGWLYQGGSNFPEAMAFGYIAGEHASALEDWV
ncbi:MAG: FAD-binding protein [Coriobacteriia bacterium]|nr:FAD-binding protein [Coriobacteriia bacterium]